MKKFLKNNLYLFVVLALSIPAVWALFHKGFYGASDDLHIAWLFEMDKLFKIGQFPPRFVPDLSFGFGYPLFNFVFPLPFYIGEIFHLIGITLVDSVKIVFGISLIGSAVTMYLLLKEFLSKELAIAGSMIYLYTPYRSTDVYLRGALGEALSFVFLPLCILAVLKIHKNNSKPIPLLALSVAFLILSHNIVSFMFFPFLLLLIIITKNWRSQVGIILGLLISSYFWLPAILDSKFMAYGTVFNFVDHFPTIKQLLTPYFGYGASVPGPYDGMSFYLGTLNLIVLIAGFLGALFVWKKIEILERKILIWSGVVLLVSIFMMNFRSSFLWENLPLLPYFQFPWRFLTLTTFITPIFLIPFKYFKKHEKKYLLSGIFIILTLAINYKFFKPHDFLERLDDYYINRYIPTPVASNDYVKTQEEYLRLPKATGKRPDKNYPLFSSDNKFDFSVEKSDGLNVNAVLNTPQEILLSYNKYYFPGWIATVDNNKVNILTGKPYGQIQITVPGGEHKVHIRYKETTIKTLLDIVSLIALGLSGFLLFKKK